MDISFFIVRCITEKTNAYYWKVCYNRIRLLYPDVKIFIVDDHSRIDTYIMPSRYTQGLNKKSFSSYTVEQIKEYGKMYPDLNVYKGDIVKLYNHWVKYGIDERRLMPGTITDEDIMNSPVKSIWEELPNVTYIKSEYKGRGEILGYYYFYKLHPTDKAFIIHDSVFINEILKYNVHNPCEFIWSFNSNICIDNGRCKDSLKSVDLHKMLLYLGKNQEDGYNKLLKYYKSKRWHGCYGIMSIVDWTLLDKINIKYDFFNVILKIVLTRYDRQCLERIYGLIICYELRDINVLYGNIRNYCKWGKTFQLDMLSKDTLIDKLPITKVWTGR
tara:strand:- start:1486 stop:2472 length:987 start_codon:yes stop_codon:yes gene_type:complete